MRILWDISVYIESWLYEVKYLLALETLLCFQAGIYIYQLIDWYSSSICMCLGGSLEFVAVAWYYGKFSIKMVCISTHVISIADSLNLLLHVIGFTSHHNINSWETEQTCLKKDALELFPTEPQIRYGVCGVWGRGGGGGCRQEVFRIGTASSFCSSN